MRVRNRLGIQKMTHSNSNKYVASTRISVRNTESDKCQRLSYVQPVGGIAVVGRCCKAAYSHGSWRRKTRRDIALGGVAGSGPIWFSVRRHVEL
jgi:hypothetical protein